MLSLADFELDLTDPGNEMAMHSWGSLVQFGCFCSVGLFSKAGPVS